MSSSPKTPAKFKQPFMPAVKLPAAKRDIQALAREHGPDVIAKLVALMNDPEVAPVVQLGAANSLADRGFGKPVQTLNARVIRGVADLSDDELDAIITSGEAELGLVAEPPEGTRH
jgi:hypothetical protein